MDTSRTLSSIERSAVEALRAAIRRHRAVAELVQAGRELDSCAAGEERAGQLVERHRVAVVAALDAGLAAGLTAAELDAICAQEAAR